MEPQSNYMNMQDFNTSHQTHFENFQERIHNRLKWFLKYAFKSNLVFIGVVRTRRTPRKTITLHKVAFSLKFTCIEQTTSQGRIAQTHNTSRVYHSTPPRSHVIIQQARKPSWNCQQAKRPVTYLTNAIISGTGLSPPVTELPTLLRKGLNNFHIFFQLITVTSKKGRSCSEKPVVWPERDEQYFQLSTNAELETTFGTLSLVCSNSKAQNKVFVIDLRYLVEQSLAIFVSDYWLVKSSCGQLIISQKFLQLIRKDSLYKTKARVDNMKTPAKEKSKAAQMRAVEDIVFSTEMARSILSHHTQRKHFYNL